jgi:hypothetical protein
MENSSMKINPWIKNLKSIKKRWIVLALLVISVGKFYHYNYIANTLGQARQLNLLGLREMVCQGVPIQQGKIDHCGKRSIYGDADWGVTAYFTIYGIETEEEAQAIAHFMVQARKESHQENIPMNVQIYSVPRSFGSANPRQYKILDQNFSRLAPCLREPDFA